MTPQEFRELISNKKVWYLTRKFFQIATDEPMSANGRLSTSYWRVYTYFKKQTETDQHYIYDYLCSLKEKQNLTMTKMYDNARKYQDGLKFKPEVKSDIQYDDLKNLLDKM